MQQHLVLAYRNASRTAPIGALAEVMRLASDAAAWQQFGDDCYLAGEPVLVNRRTIDLIFRRRVSGNRGLLQEHFVRCISGLADAEDVVAFVNDRADLDGLLVSDYGFTDTVFKITTSASGRDVATIDEFIEKRVNFTRYIDSLESSIRQRGIDRNWMKMKCMESALYAGISSGIPVPPVDLDAFIDAWLKDPTKEHLTVIGEFGSGKTWTLQHLAHRAIRGYNERDPNIWEDPFGGLAPQH